MGLELFKNYQWLAVVICLGLLLVAPAGATKGPQGVSNTSHNFSITSTNTNYTANNEDEICIYCHTPHGGSLDGALWNKPLDDGVYNLTSPAYFTHYNSATLSSSAKTGGINRDLGVESLLCMGCHDGTIAINRVINVSNRTTPAATEPGALIESSNLDEQLMQAGGFTEPGPWIGTSSTQMISAPLDGGNLSDDHPVSIDYVGSQTEKSASLHLIGEARTSGLRFFPLGGSGTRLECPTCHDPHVDYNTATQYTPFLITSNEASAMCLACHIK